VPIKKPQIKELEALLGYTFKDGSLLTEALIHSSARNEHGGRDNERLEFLGDRVLGLSIAALLFARFPQAREVELARHFNALVCKAACAEIARRLQLGPYIIMAASEARTGGRKKEVILADACEALLGAILVDGGPVAAEAAVGRLWAPLIGTAEAPAPDAKTALQEYAQSQRWGLPKYREIGRSGADHAPSFTVEVLVKGLKPEQGAGPSLKKAQQAAAEALLKREAVWPAERSHA
jgi:ribonuclease-3